MKMFYITFLLFVGIGATVVDYGDCDDEHCDEFAPNEELKDVTELPNKEEIAKLCPNTLRFIGCKLESIKECTGMGIEELTMSSNEDKYAQYLLSFGSLLAELCDEDSTFHKDYMASVDCVRRVIDKEPNPECKLQSEMERDEFLKSLSISPEDRDRNKMADIKCLELPATVACVAVHFEKYCGLAARSAMVHIVRELKPLIQEECSSEDFFKLKRDFLDYLNLKGEHKHVYQSVFDVLRKR